MRLSVRFAQIVNPARSSGRDIQELIEEVSNCTQRVNKRFGTPNYQPVVLIERSVPMYEKIAYYSVADVVVVTAIRDGMNLVPYEYIVSRQARPLCLWMCRHPSPPFPLRLPSMIAPCLSSLSCPLPACHRQQFQSPSSLCLVCLVALGSSS